MVLCFEVGDIKFHTNNEVAPSLRVPLKKNKNKAPGALGVQKKKSTVPIHNYQGGPQLIHQAIKSYCA